MIVELSDLMKVNNTSSDINFVYPFIFDSDTFKKRNTVVESAIWQGKERPLNIWRQLEFSTEGLLTHVADFLNPVDGKMATALLWNISEDALQSTNGGLGSGRGNTSCSWKLMTPKSEIAFRITSINLVLFCTGVGFIITEACPIDSVSFLDEWIDFLHYFRFVKGQRDTRIKAQRRVGINRQTQKPLYEPFFPSSSIGNRSHAN